MVKKTKFILKWCLPAIVIIGGVLGFNWFLKNRIETHLRSQLGSIISESTDGFYKFSFDKLSIGFFDGELSINGIELIPDSVVLNAWKSKDSLPPTYYCIHIDHLKLEGINLIWRYNYKKLNFKSFTIEKPNVEVFSLTNSKNYKTATKTNESKNSLYDIISPYINEITSKNIRLQNLSASYTVQDSIGTSVYSLKDASFSSFLFVLNSQSKKTGKLLYCDSFEFSTNQPQILMKSDLFELETEKIRFSSNDSIIEIGKSRLKPTKELLAKNENSAKYVDANLDEISIKGVDFKRINGKNNLQARTFDIVKPNIHYHVARSEDDNKPAKHEYGKVTPNNLWTLYSLVSPLLSKVAIDKIEVKDAALKCSNFVQNKRDVYILDNFNFNAYNFLVDSLADNQKKFLYSENFDLQAVGIQAKTESNNSQFNIKRLSLNMLSGKFEIDSITLEPINSDISSNSIKGSINNILIDGLFYDGGINANLLQINTPNIEFTKNTNKIREQKEKKEKKSLDVIFPFINHLSIGHIEVKDASATYNDKTSKHTYSLTDCNFDASAFLMNENTLSQSAYLFTCDNFNFKFSNFNNLSPSGRHRLKVENGQISSHNKSFDLKNISLIPQINPTKELSETYLSLEFPSISARGIVFDTYFKEKKYLINQFNIPSASVKIIKAGNKKTTSNSKELPIDNFILNHLDIGKVAFEYIDKAKKNSFVSNIQSMQIVDLEWTPNKKIDVSSILLENPNISYTDGLLKQENIKESKNILKEIISIGNIKIPNIALNISLPKIGIEGKSENIQLSGIYLDDTSFSLESIDLIRPYALVQQKTEREKEPKESGKKSDIYSILGKFRNKIAINQFNLIDANMNYSANDNGKQITQTLNNVDLKFSNLKVDNINRTQVLDDLKFSTKDLQLFDNNEFYTYKIGNIDLSKKGGYLRLNNLSMHSKSEKKEFAYKHPKHKDWSDVTIDKIALEGIDFDYYFKRNQVNLKSLEVSNVYFQNFKNQQIEVGHNLVPMIYEHLQKLPVKFNVDTANIYNFNVCYEELAKGATVPGKIFFTNMNGHISNLTNIVSKPDDFIILNVDGKLMGNGYFTAQWLIPVSQDYDRFLLNAHLSNFNLKELNQLITPMAPVQIENGVVKDVTFSIDASSLGAQIDMLFLYNDLKLEIFKTRDQNSKYKIGSLLANRILKQNNPIGKKNPRQSSLWVKRDPYHSTFNYFWQILQPPLVESVGISQKRQNSMKNISHFMKNVKNIFRPKNKKKNEK